MFPSLVSVGWRLSPLFYEDVQILFSRPHKLFRRAIYFPSEDAAGAQSAVARHSRPTKTLATSPLISIWVSAGIDAIQGSFG